MKNIVVLFDQEKVFIVSAIFLSKRFKKTQTRVICDFRTFAQDESFKNFSSFPKKERC